TVSAQNGGLAVDVTVIAPDGCALGFPAGEHWGSFYAPCAEKKLTIWNEDTDQLTPLELDADPRILTLLNAPPHKAPPHPARAALWASYWRPAAAAGGVGTLVPHGPSGDELVLGARAALERTSLDASGDFGYALVDMSGDTGRYVRWTPDGSTSDLAVGVLR